MKKWKKIRSILFDQTLDTRHDRGGQRVNNTQHEHKRHRDDAVMTLHIEDLLEWRYDFNFTA